MGRTARAGKTGARGSSRRRNARPADPSAERPDAGPLRGRSRGRLPRGLRTLPRSFYRRPVLRVARDLLGKYLVRMEGKTALAGRIVEVEAYRGAADPASHAYRGRTKRNEAMFGDGGHLYVYFTYGMHHCANVVTGVEGTAAAVLIRALEPVSGVSRMASNRKLPPGRPRAPRTLTGGPARLCQALGIGLGQNGSDLLGAEISIRRARAGARPAIGSSPRIGIRRATDKRWRFFIRGNRFVSGA